MRERERQIEIERERERRGVTIKADVPVAQFAVGGGARAPPQLGARRAQQRQRQQDQEQHQDVRVGLPVDGRPLQRRCRVHSLRLLGLNT